jgi:hypothetical protein
MRLSKQKQTDFYFKLQELKERIEVYNEIFLTKVPKYLRKKTKRSNASNMHLLDSNRDQFKDDD